MSVVISRSVFLAAVCFTFLLFQIGIFHLIFNFRCRGLFNLQDRFADLQVKFSSDFIQELTAFFAFSQVIKAGVIAFRTFHG